MAITASSPDAFFDGEDFAWDFTVTNADGSPLDLTGSRLFARFEDKSQTVVGICDTALSNQSLFIANREALVLTAYQDGKHASVGFGSNSPALRVGDRITVPDAFKLLKRDIAAREAILGRALKVDLSQQQRDAICSFYYQNGQKPDGQGRRGFDHMASLLNAGKFDEAAAYIPECDRNSAGEQKAGLRKRRLMEQAVFRIGDYGPLDPIPYWPGAPVGPPQQYHLQPGDLD